MVINPLSPQDDDALKDPGATVEVGPNMRVRADIVEAQKNCNMTSVADRLKEEDKPSL